MQEGFATNQPLKRDLVGLFNQVLPKGHHRARARHPPPRTPVERTRRGVAFVRPKLHPVIASGTRKISACLQQTPTKPLAPRIRHQQKQPQLGSPRIQTNAKDGSEPGVTLPRNPSCLARRVVTREKVIQDLRHEHAETGIESLVTRVVVRVRGNQPIPIGGGKKADHGFVHPLTLAPCPLAFQASFAYILDPKKRTTIMGINTERDIEANLQIGPTEMGMVRLFVEGGGVELPMDFTPDEAREIADEILAAAARAEASGTAR